MTVSEILRKLRELISTFRYVKTLDVILPDDHNVQNDAIKLLTDALEQHRNAVPIDHPDGSVTSEKIADNSIDTRHIKPGAVTSDKIADNSIETKHLKDRSVTDTKIALNSITTWHIQDKAITTEKLYILDYIDFRERYDNPLLVPGRLWFRRDAGLLVYSHDGRSIRPIPHGTINVDQHASRHEATGEDPIRGWIDPILIGPRSNSPSTTYFRTRDESGNIVLNHSFAPTDHLAGILGDFGRAWKESHIFCNYFAVIEMISYGVTNPAIWFPAIPELDAVMIPYEDNRSMVGSDTNRLRYVRAVYIVSGDLGFEEDKCLVCGREFREGEPVVFKIRTINKDKKEILCVPVHLECSHKQVDPKLIEEHKVKVLSTRKKNKNNPDSNTITIDILGETPLTRIENKHELMITAMVNEEIMVNVTVEQNANENEVFEKILEEYNRKKRVIEKTISEIERLKKMPKKFAGKRYLYDIRNKKVVKTEELNNHPLLPETMR